MSSSHCCRVSARLVTRGSPQCPGPFAGPEGSTGRRLAYGEVGAVPLSKIVCEIIRRAEGWAPSYRRAAVMQASLAVVGGVAGALAWAFLGGLGYLVGALLLLAVVPFTLLVVFPTNKRLLDLHAAGQADNAHELLKRWNALHAVRTGLSVVAFVLMLFAVSR